jgi:antitoxin component YwqK of YwqJK toxin-antitoxin module
MKKLLLILLITPLLSFGQTKVELEYWDNGSVLSQVHYLDGKRDGSCRYYYKNGTLMNEGFYKKGKMIGLWMSYYENGQLKNRGTYKYIESGVYSIKDGNWGYYYDNGQLQSESIIIDGIEDLKFYDKGGNLLPKGEGC